MRALNVSSVEFLESCWEGGGFKCEGNNCSNSKFEISTPVLEDLLMQLLSPLSKKVAGYSLLALSSGLESLLFIINTKLRLFLERRNILSDQHSLYFLPSEALEMLVLSLHRFYILFHHLIPEPRGVYNSNNLYTE